MKIIGKTSNGFICEVSETETRAVLGLNATSDDVKNLKVGEEITFSKALHNLSLLRDVRSSSTYDAMKKAESLLSHVQSIVEKISEIDKAAIALNTKIKSEEI